MLGGDSIDDYIKSDNIDHFHRINDGTYRETLNDTEMITMMPMNQDNGKIFALYSRLLGWVWTVGSFRFSSANNSFSWKNEPSLFENVPTSDASELS